MAMMEVWMMDDDDVGMDVVNVVILDRTLFVEYHTRSYVHIILSDGTPRVSTQNIPPNLCHT